MLPRLCRFLNFSAAATHTSACPMGRCCGRYGPGAILEPSLTKMDILIGRRLPLHALLFDRAARRNRRDPYDEKKYRGAGIKEVQKWWKTCQDWMARYKTHSEPFVYDIKKLLKALSDKETVAQLEVDAFMENCAKRWQTRGYVPTQASTSARRSRLAWVPRCRYWHGGHLNMDNMADYYMAEENIWGAERGAFVSPCFT